jgi:hypothetical protein
MRELTLTFDEVGNDWWVSAKVVVGEPREVDGDGNPLPTRADVQAMVEELNRGLRALAKGRGIAGEPHRVQIED